jgi:hypothetical protein
MVVEQQVLRLEITVKNASGVAEFNPLQQLVHVRLLNQHFTK